VRGEGRRDSKAKGTHEEAKNYSKVVARHTAS
jgi:hypothetical protein